MSIFMSMMNENRVKKSPWYLANGLSINNCIAVYKPKGAASLAASYSNLANPGTYDAAPGVAPAWDAATGWQFDGSSMYLKTGIFPPISQGGSAIICYSNYVAVANKYMFGYYSSSGGNHGFWVSPSVTSKVSYGNGSAAGALAVSPVAAANGTLGIAGNKGYRNGVEEFGTITTSALSALEVYVGALNFDNSPFTYGQYYCIAFAIYNIPLTSNQMAAIHAAMQSL